VQFLDLARSYLPQPEDDAFPGREYIEIAGDSASEAPITSQAKIGKHKRVIDSDRVEDSEELDSSDYSSEKEIGTTIPAKPISSRPPSELKRS
jgi:hypothetical protein